MPELVSVLQSIASLHSLVMVVLGVCLGIFVGVLPGLGPTPAIALLVPLTFNMPTEQALLLLTALYLATQYGGSITSILVGIPGDAANVATVFDGYEFTKRGEPGRALGISITAATVGGAVGILFLAVLAQPLSALSLSFGPPEFFALGMVGLSVISSVAGSSLLRGLLGGLIGLLLAVPGLDPLTGNTRLTLGLPLLQDGIHLVPFVLGFFAVSEAFVQLENFGKEVRVRATALSGRRPTRKELMGLMPTIGRSSVIGAGVATIPGHGATIASLLCYELERRFWGKGRPFGTGVPEGVAAPEAAAAASVGGALIPLLTLGIPGSASTSVILATLTLHGIPIGQSVLATHPKVAYTLMLGLVIALVVILIVGYFGVKFWVRVASMPTNLIVIGILVLSVVGAFTVRSDLGDVWIMFGCGLLGFVLRKMRIPPAPVVMAFILEPIIEMSFRRSLMISNGNPAVFVNSSLAVGLLLLATMSFLFPIIVDRRRRVREFSEVHESKPAGEAQAGQSSGHAEGPDS